MTAPALPNPGRGLRRWIWPVAIATVLIASALSNIVVMLVAKNDPAFAVEPDYYGKAVRWDDAMAQERQNVALGWRSQAGLSLSQGDEVGTVTVTLQDAAGVPLQGATVSVEAMHNARAADRREVTLVPMRPGTYWAPIDARRPGEWELRLTAVRGDERYTRSIRANAR